MKFTYNDPEYKHEPVYQKPIHFKLVVNTDRTYTCIAQCDGHKWTFNSGNYNADIALNWTFRAYPSCLRGIPACIKDCEICNKRPKNQKLLELYRQHNSK